jgi:hypothetical protein
MAFSDELQNLEFARAEQIQQACVPLAVHRASWTVAETALGAR